ncbi:hypothetical protein Salat_0843500 [Sesamum alatum]|uniref:Uncharacterized protein n=1 Tax=Sesamum alatum TaxID=300844 RepID=A0AAE2CQI7_9LAMI|nr:hypothetical protein Salat_0843500 [Sesamum alatum]
MLPPLDLDEIKNRMIEAGLIDHGFRAKAILEDELLIVAETMMNRAAVRKFIPEDVPAIPLSLGARSALATLSDPPSLSAPHSVAPPLVQSYSSAFPSRTPMIDVSTSPKLKGSPFQTPLKAPPSSLVAPPVDFIAPSHK